MKIARYYLKKSEMIPTNEKTFHAHGQEDSVLLKELEKPVLTFVWNKEPK